MLNKLALFFKKFPVIHKILSFIYNKFILNVTSGYYLKCAKYFITIYFPEKKHIKSYGFKKIKPFNTHGWRWGLGIDKAYRRYYKAVFDGKKCFVKVAKNDATIVNEIKINSYLKDKYGGCDFTPNLVLTDNNFDKNTVMIALEFVENLETFNIPQNIEEFDYICKSFLDILQKLNDMDIIHADVHKGNLMLKQNKVMLLDFGISKSVNVENTVDYKARPGTFYRINGNTRTYNDAYSFVKMLEKMNVSEEFKKIESYKNIEKRCEDNSMTVEIL